MLKKQKWYFTALNKELVHKEEKAHSHNDCKHEMWIAKCSICGKVLASEIQNVTEIDIIRIVEQIKEHICLQKENQKEQ